MLKTRDRSASLIKCFFVAAMVLFAQQAALMHALAHAEEQLAQPHKGKAPSHPIEQCIAFHAVDSALTASLGLVPCAALHGELLPRELVDAHVSSLYRLPARAPPPAA